MSDAASAQVNAQKRRLIAARAIDESEKRMYVQVGSQTLFFLLLRMRRMYVVSIRLDFH